VDKPTFLWAGGWFIHVLYQLAGVRATPWTLSFDPDLPVGFEIIEFDLAAHGSTVRVSWSGAGMTFRRIRVDGLDVPSAVLMAPAGRIHLERGMPEAPYVAAASGMVEGVRREGNGLVVEMRTVPGQVVTLEVVGPEALRSVRAGGRTLPLDAATVAPLDDAVSTRVVWLSSGGRELVTLQP
jgi:hypothetical protein